MCDGCSEEITKEQADKARKMGRKIFHFECPRTARDRAWGDVLRDFNREDI